MLTASLPSSAWEGTQAETNVEQVREWLRVAGFLQGNLQEFINDLKAQVPVEVTSSEMRKRWAHHLDRVHAGDETIYITQHGTRVAALVPPYVAEHYESDQAWFRTPEWRAKEAEADADIAEGRVTQHDSDEDFFAALRK